jgi:hypothetical protein
MTISVHDNKLISYTVNSRAKTILFETIFVDAQPNEYTNVAFSDVVAYSFEKHTLDFDTYIFDIEEVDPNQIMKDNWTRFVQEKNWGWPAKWADTQDTANAYFKTHAILGYEISSSSGLCGWVLAKDMQIYAKA